MNNEQIQIENVSTDVIYQQDKAQIDMQIATAKAYPRNIKRATENIVAIATMDYETASTCGYALPRGGKQISGPSVHLAKIIAQQWGNMRIEAKVVDVSDKTLTSQAVAFDLENNVAIKVEVKRSIMTKTGRMTDDMIVVTGNAANSIALRNAILAVVPKAVTDKAYRASIKAITGDLSDKEKFISKRKKVFDGFKDTYQITEKDVLMIIGKSAIDHVTVDDLSILIQVGQALKDGDVSIEDVFRPNNNYYQKKQQEKETDRLKIFIQEAKTLEQLQEAEPFIDGDLELIKLFDDKKSELNAN